jgi:hypothetical protein
MGISQGYAEGGRAGLRQRPFVLERLRQITVQPLQAGHRMKCKKTVHGDNDLPPVARGQQQ